MAPAIGLSISLSRPRLSSVGELAALCDVDDIKTGRFLRSTFAYVDEHDYVWFGQLAIPRTKLTMDDLNQTMELVRDERVYPLATPLITIVDDAIVGGAFIKRPKLSHLDEEDCWGILPRMFYEEAAVLETLKRYPHPNVVQYHGCTVKRSHITGIVLERHKMTLADRIRSGTHDFDEALCIGRIQAGVSHLHSLGYAHNDLNPRNIALDHDDRPVLIDFGSCKKFGEELLSAGTPSWADEYFTSEAQHDRDAINKIKIWLAKGRP